ncbi:MFS-type transporter SLC18B1-like [Anthonomus grandis grandis]|uniref:MFS-type transporter SLC18B1-like n=1 Tax=Anthonomus grandis grandis TaxID=2921223 RepID=UPI002165A656|nr:MFS-type transporter SLC18B1-like [Anthonomus grandis grandis]
MKVDTGNLPCCSCDKGSVRANADGSREDGKISGIGCCGGSKKGKKKKTLTCTQKVSLVMLALADFMSVCSMSIISPFYPAESASKGVPESLSGLVFGAYALVVFLTSPIFGKILPKFGAKYMFISGLLVSGVSSIIFGLVDRIHDYTWFVTASFCIRAVEALGASAYSTASYVLIINIFPDNAGSVRGLLETFVGLGLSAGPGLGGVLYAIGGFGLPFYVVGVTTIFIAILNAYLLSQPKKNEVETSGSFRNLLKLWPVLITCGIIVITSMTGSYLDPTLEPHLRAYDLSSSQVGLMFLLLSATYGVTSPLWGWMSEKFRDYSWLMTTGLFGSSVVLLFMGPSPVFTFLEDSIPLNAAALSALGIFIAMSLIPTYQFILDSAMENGFQENLGTHSVVAGLWSSVYSLGEVIGPISGGFLLEKFDFPITSSVYALLNFICACGALLYFKMSRRKPKTVEVTYVENGIYHIECKYCDVADEENVDRDVEDIRL